LTAISKSKICIKIRLPICKIYQLFHSLVFFYFTVHQSAKHYVPKKVFAPGSGSFAKACEKEMERKNTLYSKLLHFFSCLTGRAVEKPGFKSSGYSLILSKGINFFLIVFYINCESCLMRYALLPQDDTINDTEP